VGGGRDGKGEDVSEGVAGGVCVKVGAGVIVRVGALVVISGGGWQAPSPTNKAKMRKQLKTDRLENISSIHSFETSSIN